MQRKSDLLMAAFVVVAVMGFFIHQFFGVREGVEARFLSRAMHLKVEVAGAVLTILNHDTAYFRDCRATLDRRYRLGESFPLPASGVGAFVQPRMRLRLEDFTEGGRPFEWRRRSPSRLEIFCDQYAETGAALHKSAPLPEVEWVALPARWVGRPLALRASR